MKITITGLRPDSDVFRHVAMAGDVSIVINGHVVAVLSDVRASFVDGGIAFESFPTRPPPPPPTSIPSNGEPRRDKP